MARRSRAREEALFVEVFHHLFASVCEEMGAALMRSAFSANIKERRDFSCALFDADGQMVAQAAHLPVHLGAAPLSVAAAIERIPPASMSPGDAIALNDPYLGGTHLPDITLVSPVFLAGRSRPSFYCANRAHHADVGGAHPGSMGPNFDVHGEGVRIPPVLLVRAGEPQRDVFDLLLANMRVPEEREGDLLAQWSSNRLGERRLEALAGERGERELVLRAGELCDWTERLTRAELGRAPDGRATFSDTLETGTGPVTVHVEVVLEKDTLTCDFRGTDDQSPAPVNTTRAVVLSAVTYVLRLLLPSGTPTNGGILRCARVLTRPGSLVDARYPACVAAGNVETSQRIVDVLFGALAEILPDRVPAASAGTMSNLTFGGTLPGGGPFAYYETIAGGAGAGPYGDGAHAVQTHMTNTRNTPIEALESALPVRVTRYTIARGSGGRGLRRGGDGIERRLAFLAPSHVSLVADRHRAGAWGLAGGCPGRVGSARLARSSRKSTKLDGHFAFEVEAGTELFLTTPGGGGHGAAPRTGSGGGGKAPRRL